MSITECLVMYRCESLLIASKKYFEASMIKSANRRGRFNADNSYTLCWLWLYITKYSISQTYVDDSLRRIYVDNSERVETLAGRHLIGR